MSFGSSLDTKEQVKQAIDIVELVVKYIPLRRQGRHFVGLCPWHQDTRPSLQVNPERQSFKCWVCDIGGDVFSFVMKMEGVEFREALAMLADQAGIALKPLPRRPAGTPGSPGTAQPASGEGKRTLYQAMGWAEKQYHECLLRSPEAEPARRYLQKRGITAESIRKFHLGFSPNRRDWILRQTQGAGFNPKILEAIGLLARPPDGGQFYDRFRGRLLFSIRDPQDRPVGLGGRVLPESGSTSRAKYINSPETPLFSKSTLLYGLDVARQATRTSRTALVMEGYTDCIIAHQHGFGDAVAVLGTALGDRHIQTLKRYVDRIILVLDGDEAGQRRANEVLELFVARQVDLRIVTLPEGMDPADFLAEHGAEAFSDLLASRAVDALEHAFRAATQGVDLEGDVDGVSRAQERLLAVIAKAPRLGDTTLAQQRNREWKILSTLAMKFRVPEETIRARLRELRRATQRRAAGGQVGEMPAEAPTTSKPAGSMDPWQRELLEILIRNPQCVAAARAEIRPEQLGFEPCRRIYRACCRLSDGGTPPTFERLMLEFDDPATKSLLVELDENGLAKGIPDPEALLQELIAGFRRREASKQGPADMGTLREGGLNEDQQLDLLRKIEQQARTRHGISDPTDG